jgi:hypothetical protein
MAGDVDDRGVVVGQRAQFVGGDVDVAAGGDWSGRDRGQCSVTKSGVSSDLGSERELVAMAVVIAPSRMATRYSVRLAIPMDPLDGGDVTPLSLMVTLTLRDPSSPLKVGWHRML